MKKSNYSNLLIRPLNPAMLLSLAIITFLFLVFLIPKNIHQKPQPTLHPSPIASPSTNSEKVNGIYGNQDFVVDYQLIDNLYVYDNPENLNPDEWYQLHQYYPTDYGYGEEEFSAPKNTISVDSHVFQYGEVFSYPSNYYAVLLTLNGKMYLKNYDKIPTVTELRLLLTKIDNIN
jgi:hypothetical protein